MSQPQPTVSAAGQPQAFALTGDPVRDSFAVAYVVLFSFTIVTLIQALTTTDAVARHVLNLETAVSVVAGYFYMRFAAMAQARGFDPAETLPYRYLDWSITTPMLLLALMLYLSHVNGGRGGVKWGAFLAAVALNYAMLAAGYAGDSGRVDHAFAGVVSFGFFAALVAVVWSVCRCHRALFYVFAALWSLYGVVYFLRDDRKKAIAYNALDVASKAVVGVYMWLYFGRVLA